VLEIRYYEYSGLDGAFLIGSGGEGHFGLQWHAPATYPKPPGLSSPKIAIEPAIP
jgi:hypothetical protein